MPQKLIEDGNSFHGLSLVRHQRQSILVSFQIRVKSRLFSEFKSPLKITTSEADNISKVCFRVLSGATARTSRESSLVNDDELIQSKLKPKIEKFKSLLTRAARGSAVSAKERCVLVADARRDPDRIALLPAT